MKDITKEIDIEYWRGIYVKGGDKYQFIQTDPDILILKHESEVVTTGAEQIQIMEEEDHDYRIGLEPEEAFSATTIRYTVLVRHYPMRDEDDEDSIWDTEIYDGSRWEEYGEHYWLDPDEDSDRVLVLPILGHGLKPWSRNEGLRKEWELCSKGTLTLEDLQAPKTDRKEWFLPPKLREMVDKAFPEAKGLQVTSRYSIPVFKGPDLWFGDFCTLLGQCYTTSEQGEYKDESGERRYAWQDQYDRGEIVLEDDRIKSFIGGKIGHDLYGFGVLEYFPDIPGRWAERQFLIKWEDECPHCDARITYHSSSSSFIIDPETGEEMGDLECTTVTCGCTRESRRNNGAEEIERLKERVKELEAMVGGGK